MRKIFTFLMMCVLATSVWGVEIVFDATVDLGTGSSTASAYTVTKDGVTMAVSNGMATGQHYRIYKGQTCTITSEIGDINSVVFECTAEGEAKYGPGCLTANVGSYAFEGAIGTWTGANAEIIFTASSNQVRATKITVTIGNPGLASPSITPAGGIFYDPVEVTLACSSTGAKIYYTTDGNDPTTSSTLYSAPFTLSETTTVKAISELDGETSSVSSAYFEFKTATTVNNIAEMCAAADETVVKFANPVYVLAQYKSNLYVKDNSGYGLFYGNQIPAYNNGDEIPAGFVGTKVTYNGEPELKFPENMAEAASNSPIAPEVITASQVNGDLFAHYVLIKRAQFDLENNLIIDASGSAPCYYSMGVGSADLNASKVYNVIAVVGSYAGSGETVYQILPVSVSEVNAFDVNGDGEVNIADVNAIIDVILGGSANSGADVNGDGEVNIADVNAVIDNILNPGGHSTGIGLGDLGDIDDDTAVTFDYDATVLFQSGRYLFLMDETGYGLMFGDAGQTYEQGDIVPAGFGGTKTTYNMEPEVKDLTGFQAKSGHVDVVPEELTTFELNHELFGHYVVLKNVLIDLNAKTFTDESGNIIPFYNTFGISLPSTTERVDVYGIVSCYAPSGAESPTYQLLPTQVDGGGGGDNEVCSLADLYALPQGVMATFTCPLTAIFQDGRNCYIQDSEGAFGLVYGTLSNTFVNGDIINGAKASWTLYNSIPELVPDDASFAVGSHGDEVEPEFMPIEEISQNMVNWFIGIEGVTIEADGSSYNMTDGTGSVVLFPKFSNFTMPTIVAGKTYTVKGFVTLYRGAIEIYPISVVEE